MKKSVNTIIQNKDGKYLVQMRDGVESICNPLKWNFFGGGITEEEDSIVGAVRETREELDIDVESGDLEILGELCPKDDRLVYVVCYKKPVEWSDITVREGAGAGYFTKGELLKIDITDATKMLVEKYL
jgi:8-oxo-dGTP pyrophosphatase MutT (NUDIX family)